MNIFNDFFPPISCNAISTTEIIANARITLIPKLRDVAHVEIEMFSIVRVERPESSPR